MTSEGSQPNSQLHDPAASDHMLDCWLESVSYLPSFLDDTNDINSYPWWIPPDEFSHDPLLPPSTISNPSHHHHQLQQNHQLNHGGGTTSTTTMAAATPQSLPSPDIISTFQTIPTSHLIQQENPITKYDHPQASNLPRKRKLPDVPVPRPAPANSTHVKKSQSQTQSQTQSCDDHHQDSSSGGGGGGGGGGGEASAVIESGGGTAAGSGGAVRKANGGKKGGKQNPACAGGSNKEGRWAEQLLNPCAAAITAGNFSRVQHLLYVLHELSSLTGSANHRLAAYGLRALTHHLSTTTNTSPAAPTGSITFATTESRFFQKSLLKFYEVSPWFSFPNKIANASILQILGQEIDPLRNLHILDIGVSHGVQWPTLLEALTRRSGGPPPLVRITMVTAAIEGSSDQSCSEPPFSIGPPGDNFASRLLCFAKSMNINLQINRLDNRPLQNLNTQVINKDREETLVVCAQFRLHHLNHNNPDERSEFLRVLRSLEPKGVILSENNMDCSCNGCVDYSSGFTRRVEYLWRFLDSTSSAFKGRESEERRMMEGEAAKALTNRGEMNERKEQWCERMRGVGFSGEGFCEDAIDEARALLRKHDNNWEMRVEEKDGFVGLWWKKQPVSFCSLWKLQAE